MFIQLKIPIRTTLVIFELGTLPDPANTSNHHHWEPSLIIIYNICNFLLAYLLKIYNTIKIKVLKNHSAIKFNKRNNISH